MTSGARYEKSNGLFYLNTYGVKSKEQGVVK